MIFAKIKVATNEDDVGDCVGACVGACVGLTTSFVGCDEGRFEG